MWYMCRDEKLQLPDLLMLYSEDHVPAHEVGEVVEALQLDLLAMTTESHSDHTSC
jgi:hypothetical protein